MSLPILSRYVAVSVNCEESYEYSLATGRAKVKPGFKLAGKLVLLTALRYGPAGVAGWAIKSVARRPLKMLLAVALEPLLSRAANKLAQRYKGEEFRKIVKSQAYNGWQFSSMKDAYMFKRLTCSGTGVFTARFRR